MKYFGMKLISLLLALFLVSVVVEINADIFKHQLISSRAILRASFNGPLLPSNHIDSLKKLQESVSKAERKLEQRFYEEHEQTTKNKKYDKETLKREPGSAILLDYLRDFYLVNISLGTPPQWFLVQPNLFSSHLFVIDSECTSKVCTSAAGNFKRHLFNKSLSSTFRRSEEDASISMFYDADIATDRLTMAGITARQSFALAYDLENWVYFYPTDGKLGLGSFPGISSRIKPVMQSLKPYMSQPIFTIFIKNKQDDRPENAGQITVGGLDKDNCEANWSYAWVNNHTFFARYWEFQINGFTISNTTKTVDNHRRRPAVIQLDFPYLAAPSKNIKTIAETAGFTFNREFNAWTVDCSLEDSLPTLELKVGDVKLPLTSAQYVQKYHLGLDGDLCVLNIMNYDNWGKGPAWILGDIFLRNYCVSFDISDGNVSVTANNSLRVGFAKAKPAKKSEEEILIGD